MPGLQGVMSQRDLVGRELAAEGVDGAARVQVGGQAGQRVRQAGIILLTAPLSIDISNISIVMYL